MYRLGKQNSQRAFIAAAVIAGVALYLLLPATPNSTPKATMSEVTRPASPAPTQAADAEAKYYFVQAKSVTLAAEWVAAVGGETTDELGVIRAVGARLTGAQLEALRATYTEAKVWQDRELSTSGWNWWSPSHSQKVETHFPSQIGAAGLHADGIDGRGVTIAVIDTGLWQGSTALTLNNRGRARVHTNCDLLNSRHRDVDDLCDMDWDDNWWSQLKGADDGSGHGTHLVSVMMSSEKSNQGNYHGVAPGANVVALRAFDADGRGRYLDVIKAIDWVYQHHDDYDIRVLNLSLSAPPQSFYWDDPLNQAVMAAWAEGIVVVAAAGNRGPHAMTIGVPANVPYIISVGAMTDAYTPDDPSDDRLTTFSSAGPTVEGFVKPEVVAPGGHLLGRVPSNANIPRNHPQYLDASEKYFEMSGTSQAAAVVSGTVALMLQATPDLTPDQVKCKLMSSARSAVNENGDAAFSVFQQGAGLIAADRAVNSETVDCANRNMDIEADLAGDLHYGGPANRDADGNYYIMQAGHESLSSNSYLWSDTYLWSKSYLWSDSHHTTVENGTWVEQE